MTLTTFIDPKIADWTGSGRNKYWSLCVPGASFGKERHICAVAPWEVVIHFT